MPRAAGIRCGALRHVIQIISLPTQQDSFGGLITADATIFATVRASIEALTGRELYQAQQKVSQVTHKVTIRWLAGIKPNMNVYFGEGSPVVSRVFQIMDVQNPDEKHHVLWLMCIERDASAYEFAEGLGISTPAPPPVAGGAQGVYVGGETPVDSGDHQHFTLAHAPNPAGTLQLFLNGLLQGSGDFSLSGNQITFFNAITGAFTLAAYYAY